MIPYNQQSYFAPYLSDTVMQSVIEKENVLNNAMVRDVLVANSQSAKSEVLMEAINQRWEPMPDYMKDEILEGSTIVSEKEKLEAELANYRHKSDIIFNQIIGNYLHDTLNIYALDSVFSLISQSEKLTHQYYRAILAAENNDTVLCNAILDGIATTWYPDGNLSDELLSTIHYFQVIRNHGLNSLTVGAMDSTQLTALNNLMANSGSGSTWARNMLIAANKLSHNEQYFLPDELKSSEVSPILKKKISENSYIKAFPNPSREYVVFEYNIKETEYAKNAIIVVSDSKGIVHDQIRLFRPVDQVVYITKNLKPGIYVCSLISGNALLGNLKLSILK